MNAGGDVHGKRAAHGWKRGHGEGLGVKAVPRHTLATTVSETMEGLNDPFSEGH